MQFGKILKNLRKSANYTQEQLADLLGIANSTVSMYERGERFPDYEMMKSIADLFHVSINTLYGREDTAKAEKEPPAMEDGELEENMIVFHRNGKTQTKKFTKEQMAMLMAMVEAIPDTSSDDI